MLVMWQLLHVWQVSYIRVVSAFNLDQYFMECLVVFGAGKWSANCSLLTADLGAVPVPLGGRFWSSPRLRSPPGTRSFGTTRSFVPTCEESRPTCSAWRALLFRTAGPKPLKISRSPCIDSWMKRRPPGCCDGDGSTGEGCLGRPSHGRPTN